MRSIAILLLLGVISSTEAVSLQKHEHVKAKDSKPESKEHVQTTAQAEKTLTVQIEATKKPEGASKAEELAAMEEALKKATEEAHKQRMALLGTTPAADALGSVGTGNTSLMELKSKQEAQQQALMQQLELEEKQRQLEIQQSEDLENKIAMAEKERKEEEELSKERAKELKVLQEEEAAQKLEAERMEQEYLAAQAIQETKAAAAKKAAAKANLARLKRKHELSRRKAEAQLQMLKVRQQMEAEQALELEHTKAAQDQMAAEAQKVEHASLLAQQAEKKNTEAEEAAKKKAQEDKKKAAAKAEADKKAATELATKKSKAESEQKAAKAKAEAEAKQKAAAAEAEKKKQAELAQKRGAYTDKIHSALDQFAVTLNQKHYERAEKAHDEMVAAGMEEEPIRVHTAEIFKNSFTFPQIANNDYAVEQFETLNIAEQNLANDYQNEILMNTFLATANEVASNLKDRYKDQWVDPKDDRIYSSDGLGDSE